LEAWGHGHGADDVRSYQKLEAEKDCFADLLAINAIGPRALIPLSLREHEDASGDE